MSTIKPESLESMQVYGGQYLERQAEEMRCSYCGEPMESEDPDYDYICSDCQQDWADGYEAKMEIRNEDKDEQ